MANVAAAGVVGAVFELPVERGKILEFAEAIHSVDLRYRTSAAPTMPATFLFTTMFWQRGDADPWPALGFDRGRALHGEQEYVFHGPPPVAGDVLTCRSRITDVFEKAGKRGGTMTFAVIATEFRDASGRLRAEGRMTGIELAAPPGRADDAGTAADAGSAATATATDPGAEPCGPAGGEATTVGTVPPPRTVGPVTRTDIVRYQAACGDMNPVHHDEEFARAAGFPMPFSVGMYQAGALVSWATDWLGVEHVRRVCIRFEAVVWPGDVLTLHGDVSSLTEGDTTSTVELELTCKRQTGGAAVRAWTTFELPRRGA